MKRFISCFIIVCLCALLFSSCSASNRGGPTLSVTQPVVSVSETTQSTDIASQPSSVVTDESTTQPTVVTQEYSTEPATTTSTNSNDKMVFSSDPQNAFVSAVVAKYGVNASNLVAYYVSSGNSNGNLVYEFDGTLGSDGRPVRTKDTLKNIYTVSAPPELLAKKASGTAAEGNEYNERDTWLCRYFTENVVFRFFAEEIQNA